MKEKILKAIDKGLMNVLSTDIEDQDIDFDHDNINSEYVRYEYNTVDMGKAGIWCEYNLGAFPGRKPEDWYGDYYAWGETETKDNYSGKNYKYYEGATVMKYNEIDGLKRLEPTDDVIIQTLGNKFRMPTKEEYEKLIENTVNEKIKNYNGIQGLNGILFTAENGNTLFFPAARCYAGSGRHNAGTSGHVWSASPHLNAFYRAFDLYFTFDDLGNYAVGVSNGFRDTGYSVRGIRNSL